MVDTNAGYKSAVVVHVIVTGGEVPERAYLKNVGRFLSTGQVPLLFGNGELVYHDA